jgi:hypothetical protein
MIRGVINLVSILQGMLAIIARLFKDLAFDPSI